MEPITSKLIVIVLVVFSICSIACSNRNRPIEVAPIKKTAVLAEPPLESTIWKLQRCEVNEILDIRSCVLGGTSSIDFRSTIGIIVARGAKPEKKGGCELVVVGHRHFPGEEILVRVDDNQPLRWHEDDDCESPVFKKLIAEMKTGKVLRTQFVSWPEKETHHGKLQLGGFSQAFEKTIRAATTGVIED